MRSRPSDGSVASTSGDEVHYASRFELLGLPGRRCPAWGAGGESCRHMACDQPARFDRKSLLLARKMTAEALRAR